MAAKFKVSRSMGLKGHVFCRMGLETDERPVNVNPIIIDLFGVAFWMAE